MMKKLLLLVAAVILFAACSKDSDFIADNEATETTEATAAVDAAVEPNAFWFHFDLQKIQLPTWGNWINVWNCNFYSSRSGLGYDDVQLII
ncbi:MAG: hypothetical protein LIO79_00855 [Rikenellaceae bacterium]|nr:hypothetical protein [Rikenellaceae bacterium]